MIKKSAYGAHRKIGHVVAVARGAGGPPDTAVGPVHVGSHQERGVEGRLVGALALDAGPQPARRRHLAAPPPAWRKWWWQVGGGGVRGGV